MTEWSRGWGERERERERELWSVGWVVSKFTTVKDFNLESATGQNTTTLL